jgi:hypothetical protein
MFGTSAYRLDGVYRRCGCVDPATGSRFGNRCPRLKHPGHGSWYFAVQATDPRGRRVRLRRGGYNSPAADQARSAIIDRDLHDRFGDVATVRDWLYSWLASISGKVHQTTWQAYHSHVRESIAGDRPDPAAGSDHRSGSSVVRHAQYAVEPVRRTACSGDVAADPGDVAPGAEHGRPRTHPAQESGARPRPA